MTRARRGDPRLRLRTARLLLATCAGIAGACGPAPTERALRGTASDGLVFVRIAAGDGDLYRARVRDGAVRPFLVSRDREETWPYWSDAARALVFQARPRGSRSFDLWGWTPAGGEPRPLTRTPARDERWPSWRPDGRGLVFAFLGGPGRGGLATIDLDGREELLVRGEPPAYFLRPGFRPAGDVLVAQRRGPDGKGSRVWWIEPGAAPRQLSSEPDWFEQKPFFTPDGDRLVVSRSRTRDAPREVVLLDREGRATRLAPSGPEVDDHSARPSPTREELVFVSDRDGSRDVFLMDLPDGTPRNLTRTPDRDEVAPRWSPDGERLVLTTAPAGDPGRAGERFERDTAGLLVIDRQGTPLMETTGLMADWMPAF